MRRTLARFWKNLREEVHAPLVPVFCGSLDDGVAGVRRGCAWCSATCDARPPDPAAIHGGEPGRSDDPVPSAAKPMLNACKKAIDDLGPGSA